MYKSKIKELILESNSQMLVSTLQEDVDLNRNSILIKKIKILLLMDWDVEIIHIYREGNKCVD